MRARGDRTEEGQGGLVALALVLLLVGVGMTIQLSVDLSSAVSAAQAAELGGGQVSNTDLDAGVPGVSFGGGSSTGPSSVSVATGPGPPTASGTPTQYVTLAIRSDSGTCWYVWLGGTVPWFGAQLDQRACTAPSLPGPPSPSGVSATAIGWQSGAYPSP